MDKSGTAIILAAGRGARLKELSLEQPKPMTEVGNISIISNLVGQLVSHSLKEVVVVVGYMADKLKKHIADKYAKDIELHFVENPVYDKTNNIYSLYLAEAHMQQDFYLFEADVFCDPEITGELLSHPQDNVLMADNYNNEMNGTVVTVDSESRVKKMILKKDQPEDFDFRDTFKTLNFYKIGGAYSREYFLPALKKHIDSKDLQSYYERIIKESIDAGHVFHFLKPGAGRWWEIDTLEDLEKAESIFK